MTFIYRQMSHSNLIIVFDTETTGFSPKKHEIVQLSYILYDTDTQTVVYATKPGEDIVQVRGTIPAQTSAVHGITKSMTIDKLPIKAHIDKFITYCNDAGCFVGHNIKFDIKMICGQIEKIIEENPSESAHYNTFLQRFSSVNDTYCTMERSSTLCNKHLGKRKAKLMEVHRMLFNQDVNGQLHNALVDISVTLRIYLYLTRNIDICNEMTNFSPVTSITNNRTICSLIKPEQIVVKSPQVDFTGELIVGLQDGNKEDIITVKTVAKNFVENIMATTIQVCSSKGSKSNRVCNRKIKIKTNNDIVHKFSKSFVSKILSKFTRRQASSIKRNKIVPVGGNRRTRTINKK